MSFKSIKASRQITKGLFVGAVVVFLATGVVCWAALPEERYRRSVAMETSSPTQISSSNKRHLRSTSVMGGLVDSLKNLQNVMAAGRIEEGKVLYGETAIALRNWHNELRKSYSRKRVDDMVLNFMLRHLKSQQNVVWFLHQGMNGSKGEALRKLCSSMLKRLDARRIQDFETVDTYFERLELKGLDLDTLFNNPSIAKWERFVTKYWSKKLGMAIDSPEVQYYADDSMLSVLTAEFGVPVLAEYMSVEFPTMSKLSKRLYKVQLRTWSEPSGKLSSRDIARLLKIDQWKTSSDSARLSVWFDYMVVSIMRDGAAKRKRESVLEQFRDTFNGKITAKFEETSFEYPFQKEEVKKWTPALIAWRKRLQPENYDHLLIDKAMVLTAL